MDELEDARIKQQRQVGNTTTLTISGGQVGVINLGEVQGSIQATVQALAGQGGQQEQVATVIKELADTISKSSLGSTEKKDALEVVDGIASQVKEAPEKRQPAGILKSLILGFPIMISAAKNLVELWGTCGPLIKAHLGL